MPVQEPLAIEPTASHDAGSLKDAEDESTTASSDTPKEARPTALVLKDIDLSLGVRRIEAINEELTMPLRTWLWIALFLTSYCTSLDSTVRNTLQSYATSSFKQHSLLSTVDVLKAVIMAASYPAYSKIADTFGRCEVILFSVVFYCIGTIVEATSTGVASFAAGAVLFTFGYAAMFLMTGIIVSDFSSLRSRLVFTFFPGSTYIINCWAGGNVVAQIQKTTTWRVGIGIWAAIYPFCIALLVAPMYIAERRARRKGKLEGLLTPFQQLGAVGLAKNLFWELDLVGIILIIAILSLLLLPFTLAGGVRDTWASAHVIVMLVVGVVVCIPAFVLWEVRYAKVPALPFHLMRTPTIWACLLLAVFYDISYAVQNNYLYTALVVAYNESVLSAQRISQMFAFAFAVTGPLMGLFVRYYFPHLKPLMLFGVVVWFLGYGLVIHYRSGDASTAALVGTQVTLGIGSALFPYPARVIISAQGNHQHLAILIAWFMSFYAIGSSIGAAVSGAIWTQLLPKKLAAALNNDPTALALWYGSPFAAVAQPAGQWGTPAREAVVVAYRDLQRKLCIAGIVFAVPILVCCLVMRDPHLGKEHFNPDAEAGHATRKNHNMAKESEA
ncbi:hypothetical protein JCM10207_000337 [Rhodosporidiobolus poonsookiae]